MAAVLAAFSLLSAQTDSEESLSSDSLLQALSDSVTVPAVDSVQLSVSDSSGTQNLDSALVRENLPSEPVKLKSVLYLGGGNHSPWYHLGVLYAIESYSIPVDSVVGTSWGAYVGYLWAKGVPLDDIQRILLDSDASPLVGHNSIDDLSIPSPRNFAIPLSPEGLPSLRHRFVISADSNGKLVHETKSIEKDSTQNSRILSRLRLEESLYRQPAGFNIPFAVLGCKGEMWNTAAKVVESIPLAENENSGELCPYLALPLEDSPTELPIISVPVPVRTNASNSPWRSPWQKVIVERVVENLGSQAGVVVRAHSVSDTTRKAWIQAGFSAMERNLSNVSSIRERSVNYAALKRTSNPWFKFTPVFDSLSAEQQSTAKTFWNPQDTGLAAPRNFIDQISGRPAFDSLRLEMQPDGNLLVDAAVHPTFDVFVGGFGSNVIGPNLYAGTSLSYVDQMEIELILAGFWGNETYGFTPSLKASRLWNRSWSFTVGYNWMNLTPLKSAQESTPEHLQVLSESRNDLVMSVAYQLDDNQKLSLNFLFGNRTFELVNDEQDDAIDYYDDSDDFADFDDLGDDEPVSRTMKKETYPVSPSLRYDILSGENDRWFATEGYAAFAEVAMQSIGFDFGLSDVIPIYWKLSAEMRFTHSPRDFLTFSIAAAGGVDTFHDEGNGYVYPETFGYAVLDNCYRQRIKATPWSSEWYDANLLSHNYGMIRANGGLHYRGSGLWLFGAYVQDVESNPTASLDEARFVVEPALRFAYKSLVAYAGIHKIVDDKSLGDLKDIKNYRYFIRIGNYDLF